MAKDGLRKTDIIEIVLRSIRALHLERNKYRNIYLTCKLRGQYLKANLSALHI